MILYGICGCMFIFLMTSLGAFSLLVFEKNSMKEGFQKWLLGLSCGVMVSSSIFSLLIPSLKTSSNILVCTIGFFLGGVFLYGIDFIIEKNKKYESELFMFAVIIHNIPEGLAVGLAFGSAILLHNTDLLNSAIGLAIGIGIQNFPEGLSVTIPYRISGISKRKSIVRGIMSGIVEPFFGILAIIFVKFLTPMLPFLLSFAAGTMFYVICEELMMKMNDEKKHLGTIGFFMGFLFMMLLDCLL